MCAWRGHKQWLDFSIDVDAFARRRVVYLFTAHMCMHTWMFVPGGTFTFMMQRAEYRQGRLVGACYCTGHIHPDAGMSVTPVPEGGAGRSLMKQTTSSSQHRGEERRGGGRIGRRVDATLDIRMDPCVFHHRRSHRLVPHHARLSRFSQSTSVPSTRHSPAHH